MISKVFVHKVTWNYATQIPIMELWNYREADERETKIFYELKELAESLEKAIYITDRVDSLSNKYWFAPKEMLELFINVSDLVNGNN